MTERIPFKRLALALVTAVVLSGIAFLAVYAASARPSSVRTNTTTGAAGADQPEALQQAALADLHTLLTQVSFHPLLPSGLSLPRGNLYERVVWGSLPATSFGIFITATNNASAGSRAIHVDESYMTPSDLADPRYPMNAFKSLLQPVTLANGVWYEMRQQHDPWKGEWILMTLRGNVAVEVDGLESRAQLDAFAGSLVPAS